jgi:tetratricopeptide (TPR) repeat protein
MLAAALLLAHLAPSAPGPAPAPAPKPTVAVVPFATLSAPEYAAIGPGAAIVIVQQLLELRDVNVVTPAELSQLLRRRDLTTGGITRGQLVVELAKALGADYVITGSYQARWPDLQVTMRIVDGKDGRVRAEAWELVKLERTLSALDDLAIRTFSEMGWPKWRTSALGTTNLYAFREAALAEELLSVQSFGARPRAMVPELALRKAKLHCEEAVRLDPKWPVAHGCLALANALGAVARHDAQAAQAALDAAAKAQTIQTAYGAYLARLERGEPKEALAGLEAALERLPGALVLASVAGEHHQIRGAHAEAREVFERYLERAPSSPLAMARLGKSLVALGEDPKGLAITERALEASGRDPQIMVELGSRLIDLSRLDDAEKVLTKAMEADKRDGRIYLRLGYIHLLKKKPAQAIAVLERSIAESDLEDEWRARAFAHFDLARAHGQAGAVDEAFRELELAVENGFGDRALVEHEADLAALAKDPRWTPLLERMKR